MVEKMLTNWLSLCMYKYLRVSVTACFFMIFNERAYLTFKSISHKALNLF